MDDKNTSENLQLCVETYAWQFADYASSKK